MEFGDLISENRSSFRFGGGIVFPIMHDVSTTPEGGVVVFAEKDGVFYQVADEIYNDEPVMILDTIYNRFGNRRYYFKDSGSKSLRLEVSRSLDIHWRPSFVEAPYMKEDEAKNEFYRLLRGGKLKVIPNGLLYASMVNTTFQKTPPILKAAFNALVGLKKYKRR